MTELLHIELTDVHSISGRTGPSNKKNICVDFTSNVGDDIVRLFCTDNLKSVTIHLPTGGTISGNAWVVDFHASRPLIDGGEPLDFCVQLEPVGGMDFTPKDK